MSENSLEDFSDVLKKLGVNILFCQKLVSVELQKYLFVLSIQDREILVIERLAFGNSQLLARITKKLPISSIFLIKQCEISQICVENMRINNNDYLVVGSDKVICVLCFTIFEEEYRFIQHIFRVSYKVRTTQVLFSYFINKTKLKKLKKIDWELPSQIEKSLLKLLTQMPKTPLILEFLDISLMNFCRCSDIDLSSVNKNTK